MMIARRTFSAFGDLVAMLGMLAPPDTVLPLELGATQGLLSPEALPPDPDAAAIVAVIDHAIPFAHHLLTTASGHSRVAAIWLQGAPVVAPRPDIPFGQELRGAEIDRLRGIGGGAVQDADGLYRRLGILDPAQSGGRWLMRDRTHGAAIACTAAGFPPGDARGLAHPLIGVGLPDWALADTSGAAMPMLLQAGVLFIISRARALSRQMAQGAGRALQVPLVVNISLGISAGPRDGSSLVEQMQDALAADPPPGLGPVHFVLASGNARQKRLHAVLAPGARIGWRLLPDDRTPSELQIWSAPRPQGQPPIRLRLTLPDGRQMTTAFRPPDPEKGQIARIRDRQGRELLRLTLQARPGEAGIRQVLTVIVPPSVSDRVAPVLAPAGVWDVQLLPETPGDCEVLVQRDDRISGFPRAGRQSCLVDPAYVPRLPQGGWPGPDATPPKAAIRRNGTCNAYAWGAHQIRAGAATGPRQPGSVRPAFYTGLLADGAAGDVLALGDRSLALSGIRAPGLRGRATQSVSGTSIAAPQVTRWLAAELAGGAAATTRGQVAHMARMGQRPDSGPGLIDAGLPWDMP